MTHTVERVALKSPSPGTERYLTVHRFGTPGARPKAYFQAALHANEWPGLMALHHLIPMLDEADKAGKIKGEVIVLPYANPIGMNQWMGGAAPGRYAFDGSGNFNRNWPDLSDAVAAHLDGELSGDASVDVPRVRDALISAVGDLSRRTEADNWRARLLSYSIDADYVIDVHCDNESLAHIYCHVSHAEPFVDLAAAVGCPVVMLEDEAGGFSFDDSNAGVWRRLAGKVKNAESLPNACVACTLELRGKADISDALGQNDAKGIMAFLAKYDVIDGDGAAIPAGPEPYRLEEVDVITCLESGLLAYHVEVGDQVEEGQPIADLIDISAENPLEARTPLLAATSGLFFARLDQRLIEAGERIGKIAGRKPLAHRQKGNLLED